MLLLQDEMRKEKREQTFVTLRDLLCISAAFLWCSVVMHSYSVLTVAIAMLGLY